MSEHVTEAYEPYEADSSYDWDYPPEDRGPKILWGRVAILGVGLIVAFLLGRATKGGGDAGLEEQVKNLRAEVASLEEENTSLQGQLDEALAGDAGTAEPSASPSATAEAPAGTIYTVRRNDTLQKIATQFYGDPDLDECIAQANSISDPTQLSVGQELTIPDESAC